ncbi:OmpH family outer membrane protein [Thiomicrorhabdus indica]|uniref:OmpH family outer membrane protein n=1 Tax=Thiomicrorhabdus indica TaxID=2267253 RepID=UPI00102DD195|nr:OmpH family outer membrane protein [Thiomicrorhabdus indica]
MLKSLFTIVGLMVALQMSSVQANDAQTKLGVVNVALLLEKAPQAEAATVSLKKEFAKEQGELQSLAQELESEQKNYEKNKSVMSDTQKTAKERQLTLMTREIQRRRNDVQELINLRRNEELAKLQNLVNAAIKEIGEKQGFDLILYEGIAYTNSRIDITQDVLKYLGTVGDKEKNNFNK